MIPYSITFKKMCSFKICQNYERKYIHNEQNQTTRLHKSAPNEVQSRYLTHMWNVHRIHVRSQGHLSYYGFSFFSSTLRPHFTYFDKFGQQIPYETYV